MPTITVNIEYKKGTQAPASIIPYMSHLSICKGDLVAYSSFPISPYGGGKISLARLCSVQNIDEPRDFIYLDPCDGTAPIVVYFSKCLTHIFGMVNKFCCSTCKISDTCFRDDANTQFLCIPCREAQAAQTQQNNAPLPTANPSIPKGFGFIQLSTSVAVQDAIDKFIAIPAIPKELPCPTCSKNNYTDAKCCWWCGSENIPRA